MPKTLLTIFEKGVRKLKETLDNIISKINLIRITISDDKNLDIF